jgi:hypothetical protein
VGEAKVEKSTTNGPKSGFVADGVSGGVRTAAGPTRKAAKKKPAAIEYPMEKRAAKTQAIGKGARTAADEVPEGLPKKYYIKSTFNTHDIMHSPVEKTLKMLDKILSGERLFTM